MENHGGTAVTQRLPVHLVDQFLIINSNLVTGLGLHTIIPLLFLKLTSKLHLNSRHAFVGASTSGKRLPARVALIQTVSEAMTDTTTGSEYLTAVVNFLFQQLLRLIVINHD